ncbi:TonB-dependent receptor domain-containing protein [Caulobacter segnis]
MDAFQLDFDRSLDVSIFTNLQFGGRAEHSEVHLDRLAQRRPGRQHPEHHAGHGRPARLPRRTSSAARRPARVELDERRHRPGAESDHAGQHQLLRTALNPNGLPDQFLLGAPGVFTDPYGVVNNYTDGNYWNNNFSTQNDVFSTYVAAKFKTELFSVPVRGTVGARYEYTEQKIVALNCKNCTTTLSNQASAINHSLQHPHQQKQLRLLAAVSDHGGRPARRPCVPRRRATAPMSVRNRATTCPPPSCRSPSTVNPPTDPVYTVTLGATDIKPYTSNSYDMSLEWYNRPGGLVSIAAYRKEIKGYIGPITDQSILCPSSGKIDGIDVDLGTLSIDNSAGTPRCISSNKFVGAGGVRRTPRSTSAARPTRTR